MNTKDRTKANAKARKKYEKAILDIIIFDAKDIVTVSGTNVESEDGYAFDKDWGTPFLTWSN